MPASRAPLPNRRGVAAILLLPFAVTALVLVTAALLVVAGLAWAGLGLLGTPSAYAAAATAGGAGLWLAGAVSRVWEPVLAAVPSVPEQVVDVAAAGSGAMALGGSLVAAGPALPEALGGAGARRYLVAALNEAESFGSGGALLYAAVVEFRDGRPAVVLSESVNDTLTEGRPLSWEAVGGEPWYPTGGLQYLATTTVHPDFPTAGENILRAWAAAGQPPVDGVVSVDPTVLVAVLRELGPVTAGAHGIVTAENLRDRVLVRAYRENPETTPGANDQRRAANEALAQGLAAAMLHRAPWQWLPSDLGALLRARHIQAYIRDPRLGALITRVGADGALPRPRDASPPAQTSAEDLLGAFSQAGASKLDVFHQRAIVQDVLVHADGSATVSREIVTTNAVPPGLAGDPTATRGYLALSEESRLAHRIPAGSSSPVVKVGPHPPLVAAEGTGPFPDGAGGQVMWQGQVLGPGQSATAVVQYRMPAGSFRHGYLEPTGRAGGSDGPAESVPGGSAPALVYRLVASPQPLPNPVPLRIVVRGDGVTPEPSQGWVRLPDGGAEWAGTLDRELRLEVVLRVP